MALLGLVYTGFRNTGQEIGSLRAEVRQEIGPVRAEIGSVRAEIGSVRAEVASLRAELRADLRRLDDRLRGVEIEFGKVDQRLLTLERVFLPGQAD